VARRPEDREEPKERRRLSRGEVEVERGERRDEEKEEEVSSTYTEDGGDLREIVIRSALDKKCRRTKELLLQLMRIRQKLEIVKRIKERERRGRKEEEEENGRRGGGGRRE